MSTLGDDVRTDAAHEGDGERAVVSFNRRAPRISQADVLQAADELLVGGHRPTIDRVRMRLGRGSPNTINDHLDTWWAKLGSRLRDLPGREFPQLPERVASSLLQLWSTALDSAQETLQTAIQQREETLQQAEQALASRMTAFTTQSEAVNARAAALEQALDLAREQLGATNQRAAAIEAMATERAAELGQLRERFRTAEMAVSRAQALLESERKRLNERHDAAEVRWLGEVDRSRQLAKEQAQELKHQTAEVRAIREDRDRLARELASRRSTPAQAPAKARRVRRRAKQATRKRSAERKGKGYSDNGL